MAALNSAGMAEVRSRLDRIGFKKRAGQVFTRSITDDVLGWLGLNRANKHRPAGEVEINAVVGVRHQGVERVVAELRGEQFHTYQPPTVSTPLVYLMPDRRYRGWVIDAHGSTSAPAELAAAGEEYGVPFMKRSSTLSVLCTHLDDGIGIGHQLVYRRPVAWLLAGDNERAAALLEEIEADLGDRDDAAAVDVRAFVAAFRDKFNIP